MTAENIARRVRDLAALGLGAAVLIAAPAYGQGKVDTDVRNNIDQTVTRSGNSSVDLKVDLDNRNNLDLKSDSRSTSDAKADADARAYGGNGGDGGRADATAQGGEGGRADASGGSADSVVTFEARRNPVHTAYAAPLTSGLDTCLGSASAGVQTGVLGVSFGGTKVDANCVRLKNANAMKALGMPDVACELVAKDDEVRDALARAGRACGELRAAEIDGGR